MSESRPHPAPRTAGAARAPRAALVLTSGAGGAARYCGPGVCRGVVAAVGAAGATYLPPGGVGLVDESAEDVGDERGERRRQARSP